MKHTNLDIGFLILEDWIPALRELSATDLKKVLFALIDYQKKGEPIPEFSRKSTRMVANMMGNSVKRRLLGSAGGKRSAEVRLNKIGSVADHLFEVDGEQGASEVASEVPSEVPSEARKEKKRKEERRIEKKSGGEKAREAAPSAEAGEASATALPEVGKATPTPTPLELSEEELSFLEKQGVPPLYVKARLERALKQASACGRPPAGVLLSWWYQDLVEGKGEAYLAQRSHSFDVDDFISAALANTYGTHDG